MVKIVFDCLRSPLDFANILQVALASGICEIYVTGNSLHHTHAKVKGKVASWSERIRKEGFPELSIRYYESLEECCSELRNDGFRIIGTSPHARKSFYELDLKDGKTAIVFGTETSGLSEQKITLMDNMVKIPMSNRIDFLTLSVAVPIVVYEAVRQQSF